MRSLPWLKLALAGAIVLAAWSTWRGCGATEQARAADADLEESRDSTRIYRELYDEATEQWDEDRAAWGERERELVADSARWSREVAEARGRVRVAVDASDVAGADLDDAIGVLVEVAPPDLTPLVNRIVDAREEQRAALAAERFEADELADRLTRRGDSLSVLLAGVSRDRDAALEQVDREQELVRNLERDLDRAIDRGDAYRDAARAWRLGGVAGTVVALALAAAAVF